ncbi:hypothetical protein PLESTM_000370100 [Pleodorina starrii]|nr:hypothetical protein PLESTM_000370100 [Pleodorina starrii]
MPRRMRFTRSATPLPRPSPALSAMAPHNGPCALPVCMHTVGLPGRVRVHTERGGHRARQEAHPGHVKPQRRHPGVQGGAGGGGGVRQQGDLQENGDWLPVYRTKVIKNNLNPIWEQFTVRATQLNNGDLLRPLLIKVFDYESNGSHRLLGQCELSTERLIELGSQTGAFVSLQPPTGKAPGEYGMLQVLSFEVETAASFLDYLAGGTEIGFLVAVDFTGSNGDPNSPSSKHYYAGGMTEYEKAITGIGSVLEYYDHDKVFPMFGFGGQYQRNPTNHCFPMGAPPDSTCVGVPGLLQAYRHALSTWKLSGPTLFAPVIRMATNLARATVASVPPKYTVLLILTDGAIMDMADTVDAIIEASTLPLSILIVGIGRDDFGEMNKLDGDGTRLSSGNRTAVRDIVQFVEFYRYQGDGVKLGVELLRELPGQVVEYMRTNNIKCPPPLMALPTMGAPSAPPAPPSMAAAMQPGAPYPYGAVQPSAPNAIVTGP